MWAMRMRDGTGCRWRGITVELCFPSSLGKMAPDADLPSSLPPFSVSFSPPVPLPPALGHKSVVVYENLQHSHTSLRRGPGSYWPQLVTWRGAMNMNFFFRPVFFIFNFQLRDRGAFHLTVSDFHGNLFTVDLRYFTISHIYFWGFFRGSGVRC